MSSSGGIFDWAGVAALLGVLGAGLKYLLDQWSNREGNREADLTQREGAYRDKIETQLAGLEARFGRMERAYGVVIGIVHVWLDEIPHDSPSLPAIAAQLRMAFPVHDDMPADLLNLVARLDRKQKRAAKKGGDQ